jgi:hypothetical protein
MIAITDRITEKGTVFFAVSFEDEDGAPVTPATFFWSLTDKRGTVINDKDREEVTSLTSSTVTIALTGDDLQVLDSESSRAFVHRRLVVEATYTGALGAGYPVNDVAAFVVTNLTKIA